MTGWIVKQLAGAAGPYILGGLIVAVLGMASAAGLYIGKLHLDIQARDNLVAKANEQVAKAQKKVAETERDVAEALSSVSQCQANSTELAATIQRQTVNMNRIAENCRAKASEATTRAVRANAETRRRVRSIPPGHGPEPMNAYMETLFGE